MMLSLDTAYRSFGGEVEASSTPTICRLPDSRRHQLSAIARNPLRAKLLASFASRHPSRAKSVGSGFAYRGKRTRRPSRINELTGIDGWYAARPCTVPISGTEVA